MSFSLVVSHWMKVCDMVLMRQPSWCLHHKCYIVSPHICKRAAEVWSICCFNVLFLCFSKLYRELNMNWNYLGLCKALVCGRYMFFWREMLCWLFLWVLWMERNKRSFAEARGVDVDQLRNRVYFCLLVSSEFRDYSSRLFFALT